ncbi:MAG: hypothetical protein AB1634_18395, partial [Thermodesulfobacteriota bacterium]
MPAKKLILVGLVCAALSGCGHTVEQSLKVPPPASGIARSSPGRIVLLPFADYSQGDVLGPAFRRDVAIMEAFTDALVARG